MGRTFPLRLAVAAILLRPAVVGGAAPPSSSLLETVALAAAAGETPTFGAPLRGFASSPVVNNAGTIAFVAQEAGETRSVWIGSTTAPQLVARGGEPAPGTGAQFEVLDDVVLTDDDTLVFKATLAGPNVTSELRDSIWTWSDTSTVPRLLVRAGDPAPHPSADVRFSHFETALAASNDSHLAYFARTHQKEQTDSAGGSGLWTHHVVPAFVASAGSDALSTAAGVRFLPQSFESPFADAPVVNQNGQAIFRGFLTGADVGNHNLNGLWSFDSVDGLLLLIRGGDEAAGIDGHRFVSFPSAPTINQNGDTAFLAFHGASDDGHNHIGAANEPPTLGLWTLARGGIAMPIAHVGDMAPHESTNSRFVDLLDPIINAAGQVALLAVTDEPDVAGSQRLALWSNAGSADGALRWIARQGDQPPGCEPGFSFGAILEPALNAAGQTAFVSTAFRTDESGELQGVTGIWGQDRSGRLTLVARTGASFEVSPGDWREISALAFTSGSGGADGKPRGLNDRGEVVFLAQFADGSSGVFASRALTVPEPSFPLASLLATIIGRACLARRRPAGGQAKTPRQNSCIAGQRQRTRELAYDAST